MRRSGLCAAGVYVSDIIDKPLDELIFGTPAMARTVCHTLAFLMLLSAVAYRWQDSRLASLAGGVAAHFMLDTIWSSLRIFLWALLGPFSRAPDLTTLDYLQHLLRGLSDPMVGLPEMLGLSYLIYFAWQRKLLGVEAASSAGIRDPAVSDCVQIGRLRKNNLLQGGPLVLVTMKTP